MQNRFFVRFRILVHTMCIAVFVMLTVFGGENVFGLETENAAAGIVITTNGENGKINIGISATGTFSIDCDNDDDIITNIHENTDRQIYFCEFDDRQRHNIRITGKATGYHSDETTFCLSNACGIESEDNERMIERISGPIGDVFGTLIKNDRPEQPMFRGAFSKLWNLNGMIPADLFGPNIFSTPRPKMFTGTFAGTGYTELPPVSILPNMNGYPGDGTFSAMFMDSQLSGDFPWWFVTQFEHRHNGGVFEGMFAGTGIYREYVCPSGYRDTFDAFFSFSGEWSEGDESIFRRMMGGQRPAICVPEEIYNSGQYRMEELWAIGHFEPKFTMTTTSDTTEYWFRVPAAGVFFVDWGDGHVEVKVKRQGGGEEFRHQYDRPGNYEIKLGGVARIYDNGNEEPSFHTEDDEDLLNISGNLGAVFPTAFDYERNEVLQPAFIDTFGGIQTLTGPIPEELFKYIWGPVRERMFEGMFQVCENLTGTVPQNLFNGLTGGAERAFAYMFSDCSQLTGYIPPTLFDGIEYGAPDLMNGIFSGSGLDERCPMGTTRYPSVFDEYWEPKVSCIEEAINNFTRDFTILTTQDTREFSFDISAAGIFYVDWGDGHVEEIVRNDTVPTTYTHEYESDSQYGYEIGIGGSASGYNPQYVPAISFKNNMNVAGISGSLIGVFDQIEYDDTDVQNRYPSFESAFENCENLSGNIPPDLFGTTNSWSASYHTFYRMFKNCKNLTGEIPDTLFAKVDFDIDNVIVTDMFTEMFYGCENLGRDEGGAESKYFISPKLFENVEYLANLGIENFADIVMRDIFRDTGLLTECPPNDYTKYNTPLDSAWSGRVACVDNNPSTPDEPQEPTEPDDRFIITTIPDTTSFTVPIGASGTFVIDCGDGKVPTEYHHDYRDGYVWHTCEYETPGAYQITITGTATEYPGYEHDYNIWSEHSPVLPLYWTGTSHNIASISGSLGAIFPTLNVNGKIQQPSFQDTFHGAGNLTGQIPKNLFKGIYGVPFAGMFAHTFTDTVLTGFIPPELFMNLGADLTGDSMKDVFDNSNNMDWSCPNGYKQYHSIYERYWGGRVSCIEENSSNQTEPIEFEPKFTVVTTEIGGSECFVFGLSAAGTFYVDWGDGITQEIVRESLQDMDGDGYETDYYTHCYDDWNSHTIKFGGTATKYSNESVMSFDVRNLGCRVNEIYGSLGALFPTLQDNMQPSFQDMFNVCPLNNSSIPSTLFNGIYGTPRESMFAEMFIKSGIGGQIPADLFSGLSGTPGIKTFASMFDSCENLTGFIPPTLFSSFDITDSNGVATPNGLDLARNTDIVTNMFAYSGLATQCPYGYRQFITGFENLWTNDFYDAPRVACVPNTGNTNEPQNYFEMLVSPEMLGMRRFDIDFVGANGTFRIWWDYDVVNELKPDPDNPTQFLQSTEDYITFTKTHENGSLQWSHEYSESGQHVHRVRIERISDEISYEEEDPVFKIGASEPVLGLYGSLGGVFPTVGNGDSPEKQPGFNGLFENLPNLRTSIPTDLFLGIHGPVKKVMFGNMFTETPIKEIPEQLFGRFVSDGNGGYRYQGITGVASGAYNKMFAATKLTGTVPLGLFAGITDTNNMEPGEFMEDIFNETGMDNHCPNGYIPFQTGLESAWHTYDDKSTLVCVPGDYPFSMKIHPNSDITGDGRPDFCFNMSARGTFNVDWGDGNVEKIERDNTETELYCHDYNEWNQYTVGFNGVPIIPDEYQSVFSYSTNVGPATGYSTDYAAIDFSPSGGSIFEINGKIGTIFPTLEINGEQKQPIFANTFAGQYDLHEIPEDLFDGVYGAPVANMFEGTFMRTGLTSIPANLFAGIDGAPAEGMFMRTFAYCDSIDSIPENLFGHFEGEGENRIYHGIHGAPAKGMFMQTFAYCDGLTDEIPTDLFAGIDGDAAEMMYLGTFMYDYNLRGEIPENLFGRITGKPQGGMFAATFALCPGLTGKIPENLFGHFEGEGENRIYHGIHGAPAESMYAFTFYDTLGLTGSIPNRLFGTFPVGSKPAQQMFYQTFAGDANLSGFVPYELFENISSNPDDVAENMMKNVFIGTRLDEECPIPYNQVITGFEDYWNAKVACGACQQIVGVDGINDGCYEYCPNNKRLKTVGVNDRLYQYPLFKNRVKQANSNHPVLAVAVDSENDTDGICYAALQPANDEIGGLRIRYDNQIYTPISLPDALIETETTETPRLTSALSLGGTTMRGASSRKGMGGGVNLPKSAISGSEINNTVKSDVSEFTPMSKEELKQVVDNLIKTIKTKK